MKQKKEWNLLALAPHDIAVHDVRSGSIHIGLSRYLKEEIKNVSEGGGSLAGMDPFQI